MLALKPNIKQLNKIPETYLDFTQLNPANNVLIQNIEDKSDKLIDRIQILFKNKHRLSIVRSEYTYGGDQNLFEIMALSLIPNTDKYEDVIGYCNIQDLNEHIHYIGTLPTYTITKEIPNDSSHK